MLVERGMSNSEKQTDKSAFQESGFGKSLEGGQEIKVWKINPAFEKAEWTIEFEKQEPIHIGPKPVNLTGEPLTTKP